MEFEELEPRLLFSAVPLLSDLQMMGQETASSSAPSLGEHKRLITPSASATTASSPAAASTPAAPRQEIIFVDAATPNAQALVDQLRAQQHDQRHIDVFLIDAQQDGVAQIGQILSRLTQPVDAIHIISHGTDGRLQLGSTSLDASTLPSHAGDLAAWSAALAPGADLLLYGCDVASTPAGERFVADLHLLTGADVAASQNLTGDRAHGGDWLLEFHTGFIDSANALDARLQSEWQGVLTLSSTGSETRVNTTTTNPQQTSNLSGSQIATDASGNYVVVWEDTITDYVYARKYNADGTAATAEFQVNTDVTGARNKDQPTVAMDSNGNFVIAWRSELQDGSSYGIYAQRYNASAVKQGSEFRVNTTTTGIQERPAIAMSNTGFVVTWSSNGQDGSLDGVYAQRYNASGVAQGSEFRVNTTTTNDQNGPDIGMDASGNFVIAWTSTAQDGSLDGVYAQRYNATGVAQGGEFAVNTTTSNDQVLSGVGMNDAGNFVIAWTSTSQDGSLDGAYARSYNSAGTALSAEIQLNSTTTSYQRYPTVALNGNGDFVAAWQSNTQDGSLYGIYARQFTSTGTALTSEMRINTTTSGDQIQPSISWQGTQAVVVWSGDGTGDADGVFFQRVAANTAPLIISNGGGGSASINVAENVAAVTTVVASDGEGQSVTYSITGGADAAKFSINSSTGALTFVTPPDYENPTDSGGNNVYDLTIQASDGALTDTQTIAVTITAVNDNTPVITSNGGGGSAGISIAENTTAVTTVTASDADVSVGNTLTYSISGVDAARFTISSTGVLSFTAAPDYENPTDSGGNNVYDVTVQVSDGLNTDTQALAVTVTDISNFLVVTTTADANDSGLGTAFTIEQLNASKGTDGKVSLREALIAANNTAGLDTISFNITGTAGSYGEYTITSTAASVIITEAVNIDASTQSGYGAAGHPLIVLDGNDVAAYGVHLSATSDGSTVRALVIRNFSSYGVYVPAGSDNQTLVGNYIGSFNADGSNAGAGKGNSTDGIYLLGANAVIGGTTAADRNVISGNTGGPDIYLATGANGAVIKGNYIGTNAAGTAIFSTTNPDYGIMIESSATNVTIGGTAAGSGNVISGHNREGIWVTTTGTTTIQGNYIGTNAAGTADLGNTRYGIYLDDAGTATIGGTAAGAGNVISGNNLGGIYAANGGVTVQGNIIGLNASGTAALGNTGAGIEVRTTAASTIGGNAAAARNVISGNSTYGIDLETNYAHTIKGNYIGVASDGTTLLGNGSHGIYVNIGGQTIGGKTSGDGNVIAGNGGDGISVIAGTGTLYYRNSIHGNTGQAIDLGNDGVTLNDYNDGDGGANYLNNHPVISSAVTNGSVTKVTGSIDYHAHAASDTIYIEFYSSPSLNASGQGEGKTYLGYVIATTEATTGDYAFSVDLPAVAAGQYITAVGNVETYAPGGSEFSPGLAVTTALTAPRGKLIWTDNDQLDNWVSNWTGSAFTAPGMTGLNLGSDVTMMTVAEAPTRDEFIMIGSADASGKIEVIVWNGTNWSAPLGLHIASPSAAASQYNSFGIAYESQSGDAILVWDNGGTGTTGLSYAVWNGSTWSAINTITAPVSGEPLNMKLVASPISDQVVLVATTNTGNNNFAMVWNGSSWGNGQTLGTNSNKQYFEINAAYEAKTGRALVVYDNSASDSSSLQYRVWSGSAWGSEQTVAPPAGITAASDVYVTAMASDPTSNRLALAVKDAANEVWLSVWDGSAWGSKLAATTSGIDSPDHHATMAVAFESQSGDLLTAYGKAAGPNIYYRTWTSGGGWSAENVGPSAGATDITYSLKLYSDPYSNTIMLGSQDGAYDLNFAAWDGSAWGSVTTLDNNTVEYYRENYAFAWNVYDPPTISNLAGDTLAYNEEDAATVIDQGSAATVSDGEGLGFSGGNLTVSFTSGTTAAEDVLGIRNQGAAAGQIGISGSNVTYGGTVIGTWMGGSNGAALVITLNAMASNAAVGALVNNITYVNTNTTTPSTTSRTVRYTVTNTRGSTSTLTDATVAVTAVNDAPVNAVPAAQVTNEDTAIVFSSGNGNLISISDVDAASGSMQITIGVLHGTLTLSGITGLSFTTGDGTGDASMVFTGTVANVNAALAGMTYAPTANDNGSDTLSLVTSDQGNTGSGGAKTDSDSVAITVNAVNDAPVNTVPSAQVTNEDTSIVFSSGNGNLIAISDVDAASGSMQITIGVLHGTLTLSGTTGLSFTTGDGTADASMVFTGTVANINAALAGMTYAPTANYNGSDTLSMVTSDQGNTGSGGTKTDSDSVAITVNAVNDAPVNTVPAAQITNEDTAIVFSSGNGNLISISDVDAASGSMQVTIGALNGALTLSRTTGLSFTTGDGTADAAMVFTGTVANINAALAGMTYAPTANYNGSDTLSMVTSDQGNTGNGGAKTDSDDVAITVNAVNDAPVNTVPAAQITNEDTPIVFSSGNGTLISISDVDAASGNMQLTLSVLHGALTLSGITGLSFTTGDGTADASMVFTGTVANINAALAGMTYAPTANYNGSETLSLVSSDQGNTGSGGAKTDSDNVAITVNAVNDAPVNTVPSAQVTNEDTAIVFSSGNGNLISISDVDAASGSMQVTLGVLHGVLTLSGTTGLSFTTGDGTADTSMVFTGTVANINAALAGMTYTPTANYNGSDTLSLVTSDQGNTGSGGAKTDSDNVAITVNAVNDAPVNMVPAAQITNEDTAIVFSSGNGNLIAISDVDAASGSMQITIGVLHGTLTLSGTTGLSFTTGDGTADASMVFTGTVANINAALAGMTYAPTANYNGSDTLSLVTSDQGNTGSGGAKTDSDSVAITVNAVNDAPVNTVPAAQITNEDTAIVFSSGNGNLISISDVDAASGSMQVTIGALNGALTLSRTTGLSFTTGDGTADAAMVFTGTVTNINAALAGMTYAPTANYNGSDTLSLVTSDQGNTGSGGAKTDSDTVAITVNAVNDAPVNAVPAAQITNEDTSIVFSPGNGNLIAISDVDAASGSMQVTIGVLHGTLTLSGTTGLSFTTGDGTADASMVFTGTVANINAALAGMSYAPTANYNGSDTLSLVTSDQGNTGSGGTKTDSDNVAITVNAVNDAPVNTVPSAQVTNEDTAIVFSSGNGNLISISDVDAASGNMQVTLSVLHGALTLSGITGLSFTTGDGTADASMVFTGTATNINAALAGMTYTPTANYNGSDTLSLVTSDQGNTGSGGAKTDSDSVAITLNAINDAPVANNDSASTAPGTPIDVDVKANDTDADNTLASLTVILVSNSAGTSASVNPDGTIHFDPGATSSPQTVVYRLMDPSGLFSTDATLTINVAANNPPTGTDGASHFDEDTSDVMQPGDFGFSDADVGQSFAGIRIDSVTAAGTLTLNGNAVNAMDVISAADIQAGNLIFTPLPNANGAAYASFSFSVQDDLGAFAITPNVFTFNVDAVNDAPVNTVPPHQQTNEDTALVFSTGHGNLISIADVDAGSGSLQVTLGVSHGTLTLASTSGLNFTTGDGTNDAALAFTGSLADINAALDGMGYLASSDYNGNDTLTVLTSDQGNTGSGGAKTHASTVDITVDAVNDAPVHSVPAAQFVDEDTALVFSTGQGNLIAITDVDAGSGQLQVSLGVTHGHLSLASITGLNFTTGDGVNDTSMVFTGTLADINAALDGLSYQANSNHNGADTLALLTSDQGNAGSGGARSASSSVGITVSAVNDAPVNSVPSAQSTNEDTALVFSASQGNRLSIADLDAGSGTMQVSLSVAHGSLSLSGTTGLSFTTGDGTADASMVFTGTLADINAALNGMSYLADSDYNGSDTLTLLTSDLGNTGSGGAKTDSSTVAITVSAVNDAPANTLPGPQVTNEDAPLTFSTGNGNLIAISDVDAGNSNLQVTLSVAHGSLTLSSTSGLSFTTGDGTTDASMAFTGTLADINAALDGMSYLASSDYNGSDTLSLLTSDLGNTGSGGAKTDASTVAITVSAVNDAPVNTQPVTQTLNEDSTLVFSSINGNPMSISDVDGANGMVQVTLGVLQGTLSLSGTAGLSFLTGDGTQDSDMVFTGTIADINAALQGMSYRPAQDHNGSDTLSLMTSDLGNTGSGGARTASSNVAITVNAVNDAPVNAMPGAQTTNEDIALVFSTGNGNLITVSDVDAGSSNLQITLSVAQGRLSLSTTSGLSFTSGDGTLDASMVFTGSLADINAALDGLSYLASANYNGADNLSLLTSDLGNLGSGGTRTASSTVAINVDAVNDAPVNSVPGAQTIDEDTAQAFSAGNGNLITISDVDAGNSNLQVTLSVAHGSLSLSTTSGLSFTTGDGAQDTTLVFTGSLADINTALDGLSYVGDSNYNGGDTLSLLTSDLGNTGSGGARTASSNVVITVNAINDAPVNSVPGVQATNEDTALVFSTGNGNAITVSDVDAGSSNLQVTLSVAHGSLTLSSTNGLSFTTGDGTQDATLVFTGTLADINAALDGLSYLADTDYHGTDTLSLLSSDLGNTGSGGVLTASSSAGITVNAINDAPVNSVPAPQATNEDTALVFSTGNGNAITVSDVDAGSSNLQVTLSVAHGSLTLSSTNGLSFTTGDGTQDSTLVFTGSLADINAALDGSSYLASANYNGADTLTLLTSDLGNLGSGGTRTASSTVAINVDAINDDPVNSIPGAQTIDEDTALVFSAGNGNLIAISDVDAGSSNLQVTLSVTHGSLTLSSTNGLSLTTGDGTQDTNLVFSGTLADISAALDGLSYLAEADYNGPDTLSLLTSDLGNTGSGGVQTASSTMIITVDPVNDAPMNTLPGDQAASENTPLVFSSSQGNPIAITDVDAANGLMQVSLGVTHGRLSLASISGLSFITGDGTLDASITFTGTLTDINTALDGLSYLADTDYNGTDTLSLLTSDLGNIGSGGMQTAAGTVGITINAANNAPVNSVPGAQAANEDTALVFSAGNGNLIAIADVDAGSGPLQVTLSVAHGHLSLASTNGLSFITGDGNSDASMTFTGTLADINAALNGLSYLSDSNYVGNDTLNLLTSDLGNTGNGGAKTDASTVAITVQAVNDAPTLNLPASQTTDQDTALVFSTNRGNAITLQDVDAVNSPLQITLSVAHGRLNLANTSGLSFITGDGTLDASMTFTGTLADINAALDGLSYESTPGHVGPDSLSLLIDDLGHTGQGGAQSDVGGIAIDVLPVNHAPIITSDGGAASASVQRPENALMVTTVTATDQDAATTLSYSIAGGADAALFTIDASTGVLTFISAPDREAPADADHDNQYQVTVRASDGQLSATQALTIVVGNVPEAPAFTGPATVSTPENALAVLTLTATDPDVGDQLAFHIVGGPDAARFDLNAQTGVLRFKATPDFETPRDAAGQNRYLVQVEVTDGTFSEVRTLEVRVTDLNEAPAVPPPSDPIFEPSLPVDTRPDDPLGDGITADPVNPEKPTADTPVAIVQPAPTTPEAGGPIDLSDAAGGKETVAGRRTTSLQLHPTQPDLRWAAMRQGANAHEFWGEIKVEVVMPTQLNPTTNNHILSPIDLNWTTGRAKVTQFDDKIAEAVTLQTRVTQTGWVTLSLGTVWWASRASSLITSLLVTTPMWRTMDPLPILFARDDDDDEKLAETSEDQQAEAMFEVIRDENEPHFIG